MRNIGNVSLGRIVLLATSLTVATACSDPQPAPAHEPASTSEAAPTAEAAPNPEPAATVDEGASATGADAPTADASTEAPVVEPAPGTAAGTLPEPPAKPPIAALAPTPRQLAEGHAQALAAARALRAAGDAAGAARVLRAGEDDHGDCGALRLEAGWAFFDIAERAFAEGADGFMIKSSLADAHLRVDQAADLDADLPGHTVLLAKLLRYEENPEEARSVLVAHLKRFRGDTDAHRELADMAFTARDWSVADTHFSRVAELAPNDGRARLNATIAKQWLTAEGGASYDSEALHAGYLMAARLLPEDNDPLRLLVGLYPNSPEKRIAALDEVLRDHPQGVWARVWKAYLLRQETDGAARALAVLDEARTLAPENAAVAVNRAAVLVELERPDDAVTAYSVALENSEPGTLAGASNELDALLHTSRFRSGIVGAQRDRAYAALCASNPTDGRFGNNAGLWYRDVVKDYEKSLHWYQKSVDAQPDDQDYINDTALIYLFHLRDRKEECFPMFVKVRRLVEEVGQEPIRGYWDTLENLCKYYFELGQFQKVVECADLRADDRAVLNGKPYPSVRAAAYRNQALKKLE